LPNSASSPSFSEDKDRRLMAGVNGPSVQLIPTCHTRFAFQNG